MTTGFPSLIAHPDVDEVCELRGRFGLMAFHGGNLERTTDVIAQEVAERSGASLYAVIQHAPLREHVPSITIRPEHSERLREFLDRVHTVIAVHGYGRETQFWNVLLGGATGRWQLTWPSTCGLVCRRRSAWWTTSTPSRGGCGACTRPTR